MGFFQSLFGKRKSRASNERFPLDIDSSVRRLAHQHAEAAARGERVINRLPSSVREGFLKSEIVERFRQLDYEEVGITKELAEAIEGIDLNGPMGEIRASFDVLRSRLPTSVLQQIEAEVRAADADSANPKYDDIEALEP